MTHPLTTAQFLARLGQLHARALTAADIEAQAREAAGNDCAVITERIGGGAYAKSLRIGTHVLDLEAVTRPADGEQKYVIEKG